LDKGANAVKSSDDKTPLELAQRNRNELFAPILRSSSPEVTKKVEAVSEVEGSRNLGHLAEPRPNLPSFTTRSSASPDVEIEMVIHYPFAIRALIVPILPQICNLLSRIGEGGGGFSFGYDILSSDLTLQYSKDIEIFTGDPYIFA